MIAILLVALFAAVAVASLFTLADAAVRGKNAYAVLRADRTAARVTMTGGSARLPTCRQVVVSAQRPARRPACPAPLRAAA